MQRATYLAQLYESVSSIPPDIQQCLLTIAQYGCDADQVKRWYNLVRSHFGIGEVESPTALSHQTPKPISRTRERKIEPVPRDGLKAEPPVTPNLRNQDHFQTPVSWTSPPLQLGNHDHYSGLGEYPGTVMPQQLVGNLFDTSNPLPQNVVFTGHGLVPAPGSFNTNSFNSDLMARSPSMPLLEGPFEETLQSTAIQSSPRPERVAPSSVLKSSPQRSKPAKKRRKLAQKTTPSTVGAGTMEPPPRPRRPSVPFRSNEQPIRHLQMSDNHRLESSQSLSLESNTSRPSSGYRPLPQVPVPGSPSPFEDLYIPGQLHQPSLEFLTTMVQPPRPSSQHSQMEETSEQPPLYQSPYRDTEHIAS